MVYSQPGKMQWSCVGYMIFLNISPEKTFIENSQVFQKKKEK